VLCGQGGQTVNYIYTNEVTYIRGDELMAEWKFRVIEFMTELFDNGNTQLIDEIKTDISLFGFEYVGMTLEVEGLI
tara:strand:- start:4631 stop:4858 length:228 start_codon:yes stop_codon:yes gene_type:complete